MAFEELLNGHELISRQTNSLKELPSKGLKEYCPSNTWLEKRQIENQLEERFNFLKGERIEKSNCLSQAEWVPDLKKAKVIKKVGKLWETLGHHQDNEDWLLPEEVLFLIENCELQLFFDGICISIEDCYALLFQESDCSLDEYRVYSYLSRAGLKVVRHSASVTATRYERQVKLDSVIQMQRRSPPRTQPEENVTIIDDDISIVEEPSVKKDISVSNTESNVIKSSSEEPIVIEIDDEPEVKEEIREVDSDSDSDIVCISSPSYARDKAESRHWYPILRKCLRVPMEPLIDLSDESDPSEDKQLVQSKIDLLRISKSDILSRVPSAKNGVYFIRIPDSRLLPPNIVPKYSEYRVNLNIKGDDTRRNWVSRDSDVSNGNLSFNNVEMGFQMANNPLIMKAQEMQAMAMSMIQTAANLMSVVQSANQNPNELWSMNYGNNMQSMINESPNGFGNAYRGGGNGMVPYNPRSAIMSYARPRLWFPRRNTRRRPHARRYPWTPRRPQWYDKTRPNFDNTQTCPAPVTPEVVILSDDDVEIKSISNESESDSVNKRKRTGDIELNKRLKIENDPDNESLHASDSSCVIDDTSSIDSNIKKESSESIVKIESELNIKNECDSIVKTECKEIIAEKQNGALKESKNQSNDLQIDCSSIVKKEVKPVSISSGKEANLPQDITLVETPVEKDDSLSMVVAKNLPTKEVQDEQTPSCSNSRVEIFHKTPMERDENARNGEILLQENTSKEKDYIILNDSESSLEFIENQNDMTCEEITSWEQYKTKADDLDETDSLLKFKEFTTYGNVLSALQIFKQIEVNRVNRKFKISFDVYLPDSNFKKSLKVLPNYRVILLKPMEELPSYSDIEGLNIEYQDNIPFLFSIVFNETISFYLYNTVSLNTLCD